MEKEKIDVAELLSNCPSGMELDCTMFEGVEFDGIVDNKYTPIRCRIKNPDGGYNVYFFTKHGYWNDDCKAKCVIFPKGKTTWEGFHRPFKDGDIVTCKDGGLLVACIYKERKNTESFNHHIALYKGCLDVLVNGEIALTDDKLSFATEEEKAKLFKAIKYKGYKWNEETKTLEKLPKFKVGDTITNGKISITIGYIDDKYYYEVSRNIAHRLFIENQDEWNLVPDKFNLTTLVPFESRVLVRNDKDSYWRPSIFGCYIKDMTMPYYVLGGTCWRYCIPYEGNEHLRGKTDDCDKYFKTWE